MPARVALPVLILLLAGCAADPFGAAVTRETAVELEDTPFFPQEDYQCGPAALSTILVRSGVPVHPDELVDRVYLPDRQGSLQPELLAASRAYGRLPYVIAPDFPALLAEVAGGRPVLVLQNLGVRLIPAWHYAVVIGYSPRARQVVLRSGAERRRVMDAGLFLKTWRRSGHWGVVLLRPGELPAEADAARFLKAAAAAETAGQLELAADAYRAALARWPDSARASFALGNVEYARGELAEAERWYRRALSIDPADAPTLNNLAAVLAERGRCDEGSRLVASAAALVEDATPIAASIAETKAGIDACLAD